MTYIPFPIQLKRQFAQPTDPDIVFDTLLEMNSYLSSGVRYAGMIVTCKEDQGNIYILNNNRDEWLNVLNLAQSNYICTQITISSDGQTEFTVPSSTLSYVVLNGIHYNDYVLDGTLLVWPDNELEVDDEFYFYYV